MTILNSILGVFSSVGTWLTEAVGTVTPMFWNAESSSLTLMGTLAVSGLALSVSFLIIGIVQRFLKFGA